jgi:flagella basal body P-ring formation protein FlgA
MRSCRSLLAALGAVAAALATAHAAPPARITVAREATVSGDAIRLRDVAALEGERARALGALPLGPAPQAGESRTLAGAMVLEALRRELGSLDAVTYTIPTTLRVHRAAQEVGTAAVRQVVEEFLATTLQAAPEDVVLRSVDLPGRIFVPAGPWEARVVAPGRRSLLGRVRLPVEFLQAGRPVKTVSVGADIGLFAPVVVARRPIARGETLAEDDLAVDRRDLSRVARGAVADLGEVAGRVAAAPLVPFVPIRREQLTTAAVVREGDVVLLVAERGGLRITAPGEVRADAGAGEQVRVVNRTSHKALVGRVLDERTVAVEF